MNFKNLFKKQLKILEQRKPIVKVTPLYNLEKQWQLVRKTARTTVGKDDIIKPVSDNFKKSMMLSQHSCIRELRFLIEIENIPTDISQQFSRHKIAMTNGGYMLEDINPTDAEYFVKSQRNSRNGIDRKYLSQKTPVNMIMTANAQGLIDMSKKRLCSKASEDARDIWELVKKQVMELDSFVGASMIPTCSFLDFCPETTRSIGIACKHGREGRNEYMNKFKGV